MMMRFDDAPLRALYIGGTGTISASCVRLSVETGMEVAVLNRGRNAARRQLPATVAQLVADVSEPGSVKAVLDGLGSSTQWSTSSRTTLKTLRAGWRLLRGRTRQYVHISSASVYGKPVLRTPIVESTARHNRFLGVRPGQAPSRTGPPASVLGRGVSRDDCPPLPYL